MQVHLSRRIVRPIIGRLVSELWHLIAKPNNQLLIRLILHSLYSALHRLQIVLQANVFALTLWIFYTYFEALTIEEEYWLWQCKRIYATNNLKVRRACASCRLYYGTLPILICGVAKLYNLVANLWCIAATGVIVSIRVVCYINVVCACSNNPAMPVTVSRLAITINEIKRFAKRKVVYTHRVVHSASFGILLTKVTTPGISYSFYIRDNEATRRVHHLTLYV